jgi:hypothetical protein
MDGPHARNPLEPCHVVTVQSDEVTAMGRGLLLWILGIPIPIIILLLLFGVI